MSSGKYGAICTQKKNSTKGNIAVIMLSAVCLGLPAVVELFVGVYIKLGRNAVWS